jgi:hypothetical protein
MIMWTGAGAGMEGLTRSWGPARRRVQLDQQDDLDFLASFGVTP